MRNREDLLSIIKETKFTPNLNLKIFEYFKDKYDSSIATKIMNGIVDGDIKLIKDEEIDDIMEFFGVKPEREVNKEDIKKDETKENATEKVSGDFMELHNTTVTENQKLVRKLEEKDIELNKLREQVEKLSGMFDVFKQYDITKIGELIEVNDETASQAYMLYAIKGQTEHENTYVIAKDDTIDVVKSYYRLEKR